MYTKPNNKCYNDFMGRLIEGKVKLSNTQAIYDFMKKVVNYELYLCRMGFKPTEVEVADGEFRLFYPFVDKTVPLKSIKEFGWTIGLDDGMHAIFIDLISIGSVSKALEVFRSTNHHGATSVIFVHNHPSGHTAPSDNDITVTKKIIELGLLLGKPLADHLIIAEQGYHSFFDSQLLVQLTTEILERRKGEEFLSNKIKALNKSIQDKDDEIAKLKKLLDLI